MSRVTRILFLLLGIGGLVCLWGLFHYLSLSYPTVVFTIKRAFPSVYNIATIDKDFFTYTQWQFSKVMACTFVGVYLLLVLWGWKNRARFTYFLQDIRQLLQEIRRSFRIQDLRFVDGLILLVAILHHCYYFARVPFTVDEVFAYMYFVHPNPLISTIYYPEPNNHTLFNLLASLTDTFALPPVWAMRLPSLVSHLTIVGLLMYYLRIRISRNIAWLVGFCCSVSYPTTIYALQGRGYMLMSVWALIAILSILEWSRSGKSVYVKLFVIASVAGFYTIPTFLFCFTGLVGVSYWFAYTYALPKAVILKAVLTVVILTALVYLPVVGFSGWHALAANHWIDHNASSNGYFADMFWVELLETMSFVTGIWQKVYLVGILGVVAGVWIYRHRITVNNTKNILTMLGFQALGIVIVMLSMQMLSPLRVWTYLTFWYPVVAGISVHTLTFRNKHLFRVTAVSGVVAVLWVYQGYSQYQQQLSSPNGQFSQRTYQKLNQAVGYIVSQHPKSILVNDHWFQFYLRLHQIQHPTSTFHLDMYVPHSKAAYDFIITSPEYPSHSDLTRQLSSGNYHSVEEFEESVVYQRIR